MNELIVQPASLAAAVTAALLQFSKLKRKPFLQRYGMSVSKRVFVKDDQGNNCDGPAILRVARMLLGDDGAHPEEAGEEEAGEILDDLGFEVVISGADWTQEEVDRTVEDYFNMLALEAKGKEFVKTERNAALRAHLRSRSKGSVELKHQNISAILFRLGLPFVQGYKPRGNVQAMLRDSVRKYVVERGSSIENIVDDYQASTPEPKQLFKAALVVPPTVPASVKKEEAARIRVPRKIDFASRDGANLLLGRNGEEWAVAYEKYRLTSEGLGHLKDSVEWTADVLGDGAGYDIKSFETADVPRFIEVKATNGAALTPFYVTRGELEFSQETGPEFWLYRVFDLRRKPRLFMLQGELEMHLQLEAVDYRARLKALG